MRFKPRLRTPPSLCQDMRCLQLSLRQSCIEGCTHFLRDSRWDRKGKLESESNQWLPKAPPSSTLQPYQQTWDSGCISCGTGGNEQAGQLLETKHGDVKTEKGRGDHLCLVGYMSPCLCGPRGYKLQGDPVTNFLLDYSAPLGLTPGINDLKMCTYKN